jgi:rhodanese-related sulfurtransferase
MPTAAEMVAGAKGRIENLSVEEAAAEVERGDALLVDIRDSSERAESGSIEGALHAQRGMLEFLADPESAYHRDEFEPDRRIILHCASGGRSALAAATLQDMGYRRVAHMDGGLNAWKEAGKPVQGG